LPFSPGTLTAVASDGGRQVARDCVVTAGPPRTLTLTPDKQVPAAGGASLSYVEATLTGADGVPGTSAAGVLPPGEPPSPAPAGAGSPASTGPTADASYSGAPGTLPSAMLDGNLSTTWSNFYSVPATANLLAVSSSNPSDWVSLSWESPQRLSGLTAYFTTGGALALPAAVEVTYAGGTGRGWVPAANVKVSWAAASNKATTITFDPVLASSVRLTMTSPAPGTAGGFLAIAELSAVTG
jgi:beta-galactosidase